MTLQPRAARALDAIDLDGLVETLCDLVAFERHGGHEEAVQCRMADLLKEAGMTVDVWDLDLYRLRLAHGPDECVPIADLKAVTRAGADQLAILCSPRRWSTHRFRHAHEKYLE